MPSATFDPVSILGCTPEEARTLLRGRVITPGEVEAVARSVYNWRKHLRDDSSYWVVTSQAARILRIPPGEVAALLRRGLVPFVTDRTGVRLMRRRDVEELVGHVTGLVRR
ncbi:MAG TPA: hypothetical protein VFK52_04290 [Nocardioidaceae bacterium]|nr:hypothetical protein [Nocardioidaceae bacterium]